MDKRIYNSKSEMDETCEIYFSALETKPRNQRVKTTRSSSYEFAHKKFDVKKDIKNDNILKIQNKIRNLQNQIEDLNIQLKREVNSNRSWNLVDSRQFGEVDSSSTSSSSVPRRRRKIERVFSRLNIFDEDKLLIERKRKSNDNNPLPKFSELQITTKKKKINI